LKCSAVFVASILIVDDEPIVLRLVKAVLNRAGHQVRTASTGEDVCQVAAEMERIDLLILDYGVSPRERGKHLGKFLSVKRPEMRILRMSGWPSLPNFEVDGDLSRKAAFLAKPFTAERLRSAVSAALALAVSWIVELAGG
jgi:DNA-binding NtrC family response regulator